MNGIKAAFMGRLSRDAERKNTTADRPYLRLNVAVDQKKKDDPTQWVTVMAFLDEKELSRAKSGADLPKSKEPIKGEILTTALDKEDNAWFFVVVKEEE